MEDETGQTGTDVTPNTKGDSTVGGGGENSGTGDEEEEQILMDLDNPPSESILDEEEEEEEGATYGPSLPPQPTTLPQPQPSRPLPATAKPRTANHAQERSVQPIKNRNTGSISTILKNTKLVSDSDEVFTQSRSRYLDHPPNSFDGAFGSGSENSSDPNFQDKEQAFPPIYNIIRANKNRYMAAGELGSVFGHDRVGSEQNESVQVGGGLLAEGDSRGLMAQNYHLAEKGLNVSMSFSKPNVDSDEMKCLGCMDTHSFAGRMGEKLLPILIVVADQNFPPILPARDGHCPLIIRVEDGTLQEIGEVFFERLKAYSAPHGSLPPGSVVALGSMTHLQTRGLADYTDAFVSVSGQIANRMGQNIEVIPLVFVPLHGSNSPSLVRSLFDLDAWLLAVKLPGSCTLNRARKAFWEAIGIGIGNFSDKSVQNFMLPTNTKNNRKRPFLSRPPSGGLPATVPAFGEHSERMVVEAMLGEVNDFFGLGLDISPNLDRSADPGASPDKGRVVFVGSSHMVRVAREMRKAGSEVVDLSVPGWVPNKDSITLLASKLARLNLTSEDCVVMDIWSNSVYLGSDENGYPVKPQRSESDGKYHIVGDLQVAHKGVFQRILQDCMPIIDAAAVAMSILVVPLPRYVAGKCCQEEGHITNFGQHDYLDEVGKYVKVIQEGTAGLLSLGKVRLFSPFELANTDFVDTVTELLEPEQWVDTVHLTSRMYGKVAIDLLQFKAGMVEGGPPSKRQRLSSVAPPAMPPPRGGRAVTLPGWVLGKGPTPSGRGRGGWRPYAGGRNRGGGGRGGGGRGGYYGRRPYARSSGGYRGRRGGGF
jgi:hypothetical protein